MSVHGAILARYAIPVCSTTERWPYGRHAAVPAPHALRALASVPVAVAQLYFHAHASSMGPGCTPWGQAAPPGARLHPLVPVRPCRLAPAQPAHASVQLWMEAILIGHLVGTDSQV